MIVSHQHNRPELPILRANQHKDLEDLCRAITECHHHVIQAFLWAHRGCAADLIPIMLHTKVRLETYHVGMTFRNQNLEIQPSDKHRFDTAYLEIFSRHGGPIINFVGHPLVQPRIEYDLKRNPAGELFRC